MHHLTPACPMCGSKDFEVDHDDFDAAWTLNQCLMACKRCDTDYTAVYHLSGLVDITIHRPYGPEYVTRDPQQALLAYEANTDWQEIRTNGARFVVGYTPWLRLLGYGRAEGWSVCTDDMAAILANG